MKKIFIGIAMIVIVAFLIGPAMAHGGQPCPHVCDNEHPLGTCLAGETCGVTGSHYVWESCQNCPSHQEQVCTDTCDHSYCDGDGHTCTPVTCPYQLGQVIPGHGTCGHDYCTNTGATCHPASCQYQRNDCIDYDSHTVYDCHTGPDYQSCDNHAPGPGEQHRTLVNDYGCIATSCPAIPCPEGQHCEEGACVENPPTTCPEVPCEEGYHCIDHECVPDVCGTDFTCDQGFHCEENTCVADVQSSGYWPAPFTTTECNAFLNVNRPMDDVDPVTLPRLDLKNTLVKFEAVVPQGTYDCVGIAWYGNGEVSYTGSTPHVEYYNLQQLKEVNYGQHIVVQAKLPVQAVRLVAVKDELCDSATVGHLLVTDSHGNIGLNVYTAQRVYDQYFNLSDDFQGWRPPTDTLLFPIE